MVLVLAIGIATGCVYALVAVGYSLVYRTTDIVNFAQGGFVMVGGIATYEFWAPGGLPYPVAIILSVFTAAMGGALLWTLVVLPLWRRRTPSYVVLLATIVVGAILSDAGLRVFGSTPETLPAWAGSTTVDIAGNRIEGQYLIITLATVAIMLILGIVLKATRLGREMRACAASRSTSQLLGISPERIGAIAIVGTAAIAGFGGAMIAPAQFTSATVALTYGVSGFIAAVLGGFGSMPGALVGGVLLGLVETAVGRYVSTSYETVIAFGLLLVLLAVRPQGIIGASWEGS